jgi:hypothetical protein
MLNNDYTPPAGFEDFPFTYVFDGSKLTDGQNAAKQFVYIEGGLGDFILRRVVGIDRVANPSGGQFQIQDDLLTWIQSDPCFVQGGGELAIVPETRYREKGAIRFDLYNVLRESADPSTAPPVQIDSGGVTESAFGGATQTFYPGPFAYQGALYVILYSTLGTLTVNVFQSTNNGLTWTKFAGPVFPTAEINAQFNSSTGIITFVYTPSGTIARWATFNCNTLTFTITVFPDITDWNPANNQIDFVIRADGTVVCIYSQTGTGALVYRILSGGVWGAAIAATPGTVGHSYVEYGALLDSAGVTHFIYLDSIGGGQTWNHVALSSLNVLGAPIAITTAIQNNGDFMQRGVIWNNSIVLPLARKFAAGTSSKATVFIGTPLSAPVWTITDFESTATGGNTITNASAIVQGPSVQVMWNFTPTLNTDQIHLASNGGSGFSAPSVFYDAILNPPNSVPIASQFLQNIAAGLDINGNLEALAIMTDLGGSFVAFYLPGSGVASFAAAQMAFQGVRRVPARHRAPKPKTSPKSFTYILQTVLSTLGITGTALNTPLTLVQKINDYDFELYQIVITYDGATSGAGAGGGGAGGGGGGGGSPQFVRPAFAPAMVPAIAPAPDPPVVASKALTTLWLYDQNKQQMSNLPVLDQFYNGGPVSKYGNGAIVPSQYYDVNSTLRIDVFNLITNSAILPVTMNIHLVGMQRIPCS